MWRRLVVGNRNVLEEGSATLPGLLPLGRGTGASQVLDVTSVTGWRQTSAEPSPASRSKSHSQRPQQCLYSWFHTLSGDNVALKVKRGHHNQDGPAQVSHCSQKLVPVAITVTRAGPQAGRASVLSRASWDSLGGPWSLVPRPLLMAWLKQHLSCRGREGGH